MKKNEEEFKQLLNEAEERGYRRGLNENISKKMSEPGEWESKTDTAVLPPDPETHTILQTLPTSIWDKEN